MLVLAVGLTVGLTIVISTSRHPSGVAGGRSVPPTSGAAPPVPSTVLAAAHAPDPATPVVDAGTPVVATPEERPLAQDDAVRPTRPRPTSTGTRPHETLTPAERAGLEGNPYGP